MANDNDAKKDRIDGGSFLLGFWMGVAVVTLASIVITFNLVELTKEKMQQNAIEQGCGHWVIEDAKTGKTKFEFIKQK